MELMMYLEGKGGCGEWVRICVVRAYFYFELLSVQFDLQMQVQNSPATTTTEGKAGDQSQIPACLSYRKRPYSPNKDSPKYETIRKIVHLHTDELTTPPPKHPSTLPTADTRIDPTDPSSTLSLRQKFGHLIADRGNGTCWSKQQRQLLLVQVKLDQHLLFLRQHRNKRYGEFFHNIRRNLLESTQIILNLLQIKQIMYIDPTLYNCSRERDRHNSFDLLMDLPANPNLDARKTNFKRLLAEYVQKEEGLGKMRGKVSIPLYKFSFQERIEESNKLRIAQRCEEMQAEEAKQQEEKMSVKSFFNQKEKYKQNLLEKIQANQIRLKEQAAKCEGKPIYGKPEVQRVLEEIWIVYSSRNVFNMFRSTITDILCKNLTLSETLVGQILQCLLNSCKGFLKRHEHRKGVILQMEREGYKQAQEIVNMLEL